MRIEKKDIDTGRGKLALSLLKEQGVSIQFDNLAIHNNGEVVIFTSWLLENLTTSIAIQEIIEGQSLFKMLVKHWKELEVYLEDKSIKYSLAYNYGTGGVKVAEIFNNGNYKWHQQLKK